MVAIIIAAHGESAPALLGSTTMIVGDVDNVHAVTFVPGQGPDDLLEAYGNAIWIIFGMFAIGIFGYWGGILAPGS
ncbi:hypothetical protein [Corynebacterium durum]|jgi:PTS family mannose porter, IIAB component|uniref:PTS sugar transporter subunit IIA domain-containing protein n=1 Tax=Corynebacterium durum TaxID=61592 RepID=UPI002357D9CC|nr:hypothetical protein [Corynebacterium durum]